MTLEQDENDDVGDHLLNRNPSSDSAELTSDLSDQVSQDLINELAEDGEEEEDVAKRTKHGSILVFAAK